jgi:hypothetical protein
MFFLVALFIGIFVFVKRKIKKNTNDSGIESKKITK